MKKLFIASIPMLASHFLKELEYHDEKGIFLTRSCFPAIVLLDKYTEKNDESEILISTIRDDCENSSLNNERFLAELEKLSEEKGVKLAVGKEIVIPHNESKQKHLVIISELMSFYDTKEENCKLYVDMTYGSKVTSSEVFASLNIAEMKGLDIEELCYGFFDHSIKDNAVGVWYSIRYIYDLISIINTSSKFMPPEKIEGMIRGLI